MIDPNKVIDDAQHLLKKAVNVLEEEIAAGILAAKKMEKKVIDVDEVRDDSNAEDLMSRIRRDTHDAVDLLLDAFTALTCHFGGLADTLNKSAAGAAAQSNGNGNGQSAGTSQGKTGSQSNGSDKSNRRSNGQPGATQATPAPVATVIRSQKPAKAGSTVEVQMELSNDSSVQPIKIKLNKSELIGPGAGKIAARNIRLTPAAFTLDPLQKKEVVIRISIPESCKPGLYSGLIQNDSNPDIRVIITIEIGKTRK